MPLPNLEHIVATVAECEHNTELRSRCPREALGSPRPKSIDSTTDTSRGGNIHNLFGQLQYCSGRGLHCDCNFGESGVGAERRI